MKNQGVRDALIVEGTPTLANTISDVLTQDNIACKVIVARDGIEALDYLLGRGVYTGRDTYFMPCVTLLDLSLPHSDGLEILREMRAHQQTRLLPIVAFSSSDERQEANVIYTLGANSYIGKTPSFESLVEALRQVARYWCVLNEPPPAL